ncbi:WecB/TagA/CpsF family glycosyltransferase [Sphaerisporangium dianthi]|uniref:WecB/TagA/CpsF family glycosyltransferase n=1 Tax=Sphaerisporangium dianthi TaxID=1436120 RepID=A0ABV9CP77_9ACTN
MARHPLPARSPIAPRGRSGRALAAAAADADIDADAVTGSATGAGVAARGRVTVGGVAVDTLTEQAVVGHVIAALLQGRGGHVVTPNVDICRACSRDPEVRAIVAGADLAVPDGMPLVWASKLLGTPVPERITGADLIWSLSEAAASGGLSVYLVGGPPGVAVRAAEVLGDRYPGLRVAGVVSPPFGFETSAEGLAAVREALMRARPDLVFVGLGFPKQDRLIGLLRGDLPRAWFIGCGSAIGFAAGSMRRAPEWMRRSGLEWLFRLAADPGRLARRYLVDDLPFALRLLTVCLLRHAARRLRRNHREADGL